jgi:catechol 2,3-dioxygenase-like lactoylglutathione lyase family enzyme
MTNDIGIDHIYVTVSDLRVSEAFYDRALVQALGFRKNTFEIGGDPHIQYFCRQFGYVLRPARVPATHEPYSPGLHHFCLRVDSAADVEAAAHALRAAGIDATLPRLYPEYDADYVATFFQDPDGIRLEVTNYRQVRRERHDSWEAANGSAAAEPATNPATNPPATAATRLAGVGLYEASVPVCLRYLGRLRGLVDAAVAHARERHLDVSQLLAARLAPDMLPFAAQIAIAGHFTLRACFPLADEAVPPYGEFAADPPGLYARLERAEQLLRGLAPESFAGADTRVIEDRAGDATVVLPALEFLLHYALPNFFFHLTTAYAILRNQDVAIGKEAFDGFHSYPRPNDRTVA